VDENHRCKRQYPKELRQTHPPLKCLSSGAVDTGPMSDPPHTRSNGPPDRACQCKCPHRYPPPPWGRAGRGVMNAHPLEQPVCQRSTGYSEPEKRRARERGSSKSRIRPLPNWSSLIEGEKVARRPGGQIVNYFCQTTSISGPSWPLAFQSGQEANSPSLFGAGEDAGSTSANPRPPFRQLADQNAKNRHFSRGF
jgi:hypothetical protein